MATESTIFAFFLLTFYFPNWPIGQFELIMQNKANLLNAQMNVSSVITMDYENIANWKLGENKPNSKPIKANPRKGIIDAKCVFTKDYEEKCG